MDIQDITYTEIEQLRKHLEEEYHPVKVHVGRGLIGLLRGIETTEGRTVIVLDLPQCRLKFDWHEVAKRFDYWGTVASYNRKASATA